MCCAQCLPNSSNVADFATCGGTGRTCPLADKALCIDAPYLPCNSTGAACVRISKYYWQVWGFPWTGPGIVDLVHI